MSDKKPTYEELERQLAEYRKAEKAHKESQRLFQQLADTLPSLIYVYDLEEKKNVYANHETLDFLGYSLDQIENMGMKLLDNIMNPDDMEIISLHHAGFSDAQDNEIREIEYRMMDGNRNWRWIRSRDKVYKRNAEGKAIQIIGIASDITEQRDTEEKLKYSNHLMQYIISHARSAIAVHDRELKYVYVSDRYLKEYKVDEKDVIGKHHYDVFPDLPQKWRDVHQKALKGEVSSKEDDPYYKEDGTVDWTRWECRPWYEHDGTIGGFIVYTEVITERKQKEIEIIEERNKFQSILASIGDGITIRDKDFNILFQNEFIEQVFGDRIGEKCYRAYEGRESICEECPVELAFMDGKSHSSVREVVMPDGSTGFWENTASPIRDADGNISSCVEVARNITEKMRTEKEKESLQNQLLQSQKMESIGHLAGGVAHDFNNMLGIIMGSAQLAMSDLQPNSEPYMELEAILDTARKAKFLTSQLLTFARQETPEVKPVSVNNILKDLVQMLKRSIPKTIKIETNLEEDIYPIAVDQNQIRQALLNICNNAADSMPNGGVLSIKTSEKKTEDSACMLIDVNNDCGCCAITISDTGTGIPENLIDKVFDPFFTTKGIGKGTGLGLSVTHGIIKRHGGNIMVESQPVKGTAFTICLPFVKETEADSEIKEKKEQFTGTETILMVDDETTLLERMVKLLKMHGFHVIPANRGKEAIEVFIKQHDEIDIVVLDFIMPEMDAWDVFTALKNINPNVCVLIASGYTEEGGIAALIKAGAKGLVQKPFEIHELCKTIREVLDG